MRTIERSGQFKRDFKRVAKSVYRSVLSTERVHVVTMLANDEPLGPHFHDHPLGGGWHDHRDCHLKPDLLLIYRKPDEATLQLVRLGSHSELGF